MVATKTSSQKDVVYIDVDDEITAIIDKVRGSSGKIVALVLPKRATVMQSIVNMKLLKRTAAEAKKHVVLITSEAGLMPLAGIAGIHVAKTLQSRPEVPEAPVAPDEDAPLDASESETESISSETPVDAKKSVGELAGLPSFVKRDRSGGNDTIEVDNDDEPEQEPAKADESTEKPKAVPLNKKLRVPDFDAFRTRLFMGVGAVLLLIFGWVLAFYILPKATVTIRTDTVSVNSEVALTGSTTAKELDEAQSVVPAQLKEYKKTDSQKVPATGQKDQGTKASGTVTLSLTDCSAPQVTVPAGTAVSAGGLNFMTQVDATLTSVKFGNMCRNNDFKEVSSANVKVVAQNAGGQYNLSSRSYTVAGFSNVSGAGSAMTGGTSKIVKVVSQEDVDNAKQKIIDANNSAATQEISKQLKGEGFLPLNDTFAPGSPLITASPNVGDEANEVTVNVTVTYTMYGLKQDAVTTLLENNIKKKIDTSKQNILSNGLDNATIRVTDKTNSQVKVNLQTVASAGVQQDEGAIKQAIAGKKKGEVHEIILARPGVKDVSVDYSPFWVYSTPSKTSKIKIIFQQSDGGTTR